MQQIKQLEMDQLKQSYQMKIDKLIQENEKLSTQLTNSEIEKIQLKQSQLTKLKEKNEMCEKQLKKCQEEIYQMQIKLKEKSELEDKAKEIQQKYQQQLVRLKENFDKQQKELQSYMVSLNEITKKFEEEQQKNISLRQEFEEEKKRLQEENEICANQLKICQEEIYLMQIDLKQQSELEYNAKEIQQKYKQQLVKSREKFDIQQRELQSYMVSLNEVTKKFEEEQQKNIQLRQKFEQEKKEWQH